MYTYSPLRYPGGKAQLSSFILTIIKNNNLLKGSYIEPYAGGAGVAIYLLLNDFVSDVYINDIDYSVYAFWFSLLNQTNELCQMISDVSIDLKSWEKQKEVQQFTKDYTILQVGFSTFFLNRTNRSGILKGGIIGGNKQDGKYKIDCRFNKDNLIKRIERIASYKDHIHLSNFDAIEFLNNNKSIINEKTLIYFDPPYYNKGQKLYMSFYTHEDHEKLKNLTSNLGGNWIITYDKSDAINRLYEGFNMRDIIINYSAAEKRKGNELLIYSPNLIVS